MLELMMPRKKAKSPSPGKTADVITGHSPAKANLAPGGGLSACLVSTPVLNCPESVGRHPQSQQPD